MNIDFSQFHFLRPEWFLALLPLALLLWLLWNRSTALGNWRGVIASHLLQHLVQANTSQRQKTPLALLGICWLLAVIALAGPTWQKLPQAAQKKVSAQVIVMDLSLSMLAQDVSPSRLARAKHKLSDILTRSTEGLTGLVVYAGSAHVVTPLTDDTRTILSMVESLSPDIMPSPGSDPLDAVTQAADVLKQGGMKEGHIILLGDSLPANFAEQVKAVVNTQKIPVSIFAMGTPEGAPITLPDGNFVKDRSGNIVVAKVNEKHMRDTAAQLGGRFSRLTYSDNDVDNLMRVQDGLLNQEIRETDREFDTWDDAGYWLVIIMLPFAALGYRRGWLGAWLPASALPTALLITVTGLAPTNAHAAFWDDFWNTPDQQGMQAFDDKKYDRAAKQFENSQWKGSAHYRNRDFAAAEQEFSKLDTPSSHYNRGNALAQQQKYAEAIAAYEQALKQKPEFDAAQANLELVTKLLENQTNPPPPDQQQQEQDQQENQDQNSDNGNPESGNGDPDQNSDNNDNQDDGSSDNNSAESDNTDQSNASSEQSDPDQSNPDQPNDQESEPQNQSGQANAQPDQNEATEQENAQMAQANESDLSPEDQQALQQWLERVPDEPGGLLRRKFKLESQLRNKRTLDQQAW